MKKYIFITTFALLLLTHAALAVEITTTLPVEAPQTDPSEFISAFYKYALSIGGVLAFGAIVWGGIRYTFAAGNPSGQTEGKEWIKAALWGLVLLVSIFLLLNTINPELTKLVLPKLGNLPASSPPAQNNPNPPGNQSACANIVCTNNRTCVPDTNNPNGYYCANPSPPPPGTTIKSSGCSVGTAQNPRFECTQGPGCSHIICSGPCQSYTSAFCN